MQIEMLPRILVRCFSFSCPVSLQKSVVVMAADDTEVGVNDSPKTSDASKTVVSTRS